MFNQRITDFFKRHNLYDEKMFEYISDHTDYIDYNDPDMRFLIGCAYQYDKRGKRLDRFRLCMPYAVDDRTTLMCIHEIVHGIDFYKHLNKKYKKKKTIEALPLLYEKIFVTENPTPELISFANYLDSRISEDKEDSYKYGISVREQLFNAYDKNYDKISKINERLGKGGKIR